MLKPQDFETWRNNHGLTQRAAAPFIGISRRAWQKYESGIAIAPLSVLLAMAARDQGIKPLETVVAITPPPDC